MACDFELSNYYGHHDDIVIAGSDKLKGGCSIATHPELQNMTAEEIYAEFMNQVQDAQSSGKSEGEAEQSVQDEMAGDGSETDSENGSEGYNPHLDLSQDEQEELRQEIQDAVQTAYDELSDEDKERFQNSPLIPHEETQRGGIQDVDIACTPPEPEDVKLFYDLRRYFLKQQNVGKGCSYKKPNKKYIGSGIIMKARTNVYQEEKTLAVYVDVSGSMTQELVAKALGVLKSVQSMKRVNYIVKYFSTHLKDSFYNGGGTDYEICFDDAKNNGYSCIAIITDDSEQVFRNRYAVDGLWIAGVEMKQKDPYRYSIAPLVNRPNSPITAKHFKVSIVGS
jgi:hypothetical protein